MDAESCRRRLLEPMTAGAGTGHSVSRIERPRGDSRALHNLRAAGPTSSSPTRSRSGTAHAVPTVDGLRPHPDSCPVGVGKGLLHVRPRRRVATDRPRRAATTARSCPPGTPAGTGARRCGRCGSKPWRRLLVPGPACLPKRGSPRLAIVERGTVPRAGVRPEEEVR